MMWYDFTLSRGQTSRLAWGVALPFNLLWWRLKGGNPSSLRLQSSPLDSYLEVTPVLLTNGVSPALGG